MLNYKHTDYIEHVAANPAKGLRFYSYDGQFFKKTTSSLALQILAEDSLIAPLYLLNKQIVVATSYEEGVGYQSVFINNDAIDTIQDIRTTAVPAFAGIKYNGSSGYVQLQAAGTVTSYSLTFPTVAPAADQFLLSNGSGVFSWSTLSVHDPVTIATTIADIISITGQQLYVTAGITVGNIIYYNGTKWTKLVNPSSTKFLRNTSGGSLSWETVLQHDEVTISSTVGDLFQMNAQAIERKTGLAAGDIAYYNGTKWTILTKPSATQVLQNTSAGALSWVTQTASYWTRTGTVLTTATAGDEVHLSSDMQKLTFGTTKQLSYYHDSGGGVDNGYVRNLSTTSKYYIHLGIYPTYNLLEVTTAGLFSNMPLGSNVSRWTAGYLSLVDSTKVYSTSTSGTDPGYQVYRESDTSAGAIGFGRKRAGGAALVNGDWMGVMGFRNDTTFTSSVSPVYFVGVYNSTGSYFEMRQFNGATDSLVFSFSATRSIRFNDAYSFPTTIGAAGKVLKVPSSGTTLEWGDAGATGVWEVTQTSWLCPVSVAHKGLVIYDNATTNPSLTELSIGAEHITFLKTRSSAAVTTADSLGGLSFSGYDGTSYGPGFFIDVYPDTTWTVADHSSTMRIQRMLHNGSSSSVTIGANISLSATAILFEDSSWQYGFPQASGTQGQVMMKGSSVSMAWTSMTVATSAADILAWNNLALGVATGLSHGDMIFYSTNKWTRLAAGTNGHVLTLSSGVPVWAATTNYWTYSGGFLSPATASHAISLDYASGSYLKITNSAAYLNITISSIYASLSAQGTTGWSIASTYDTNNNISVTDAYNAYEKYHSSSTTSNLNKHIYYSRKMSGGAYVAHASGDQIAYYLYYGRNATTAKYGASIKISASENWASNANGVDYIINTNYNGEYLLDKTRLGIYGAGYIRLSNSTANILHIEDDASYHISTSGSFYFPTNTQAQGSIIYGNSTTDTKWLAKGTTGQVLAMGSSNIPEWVTISGGTPYTAGDGIDIDGSNVVSVDYNTTNLKITATEIDTIQSIAEAASPLFANLKLAGYLELRDGQGTPNYVRFAAPSTVSTSYTITLPAAPPNTGNYLQYNGTNYVWAAGGGGVTYTFSYPLSETTGTVSLLYDTTNLQVNGSNQLDTIQDIATTSSPTFANATLTTAAKLKATGAYYISLKAHASTAADYDIVFPSAAPGTNTYLKYDGANYSWSAVSVSGYTFNYPLIYTAGTNEVDLLYDAVNLQVNLDHELDTIQDIATTSSPTWANATLTTSLKIQGGTGSITQYAKSVGADWSIIWPSNAPGVANSLLVSGATGELEWRQLGIHSSLSDVISLSQQEFQAAGGISNASIIYYSTANAKWERLGAPAVAGTHYLKNTSAGAIEWALATGIGGLWEEYDPNSGYYQSELYLRPISSSHTGLWLQVNDATYGSIAERATIVMARTYNNNAIPDGSAATVLGTIIWAGQVTTFPADLIQAKGSVIMTSGVPSTTLDFHNTVAGTLEKNVLRIGSNISFYNGSLVFARPTSADDGKILIYDYATRTLEFQTYGAATLWQEYNPGALYPGQFVQKYIKPISLQHEGLWIECDEIPAGEDYVSSEIVLARSFTGGNVLNNERIGELSFAVKHDDVWKAMASINGRINHADTFPSGGISIRVYDEDSELFEEQIQIYFNAITFHESYTFPSADGTAGYALTTNGSGQLGWTNISGGGSKWTDNTTYLSPTDDRDIWTYSGRKFISGAGHLWDSGIGNPVVLGSTKDIRIESDTNIELKKLGYVLNYTGTVLSTTVSNELDIGSSSSKIKDIYTGSIYLHGSTSGSLQLNTPVTLSSYELTFPDSIGVKDQVMMLDASLNLQWATIPFHDAVTLNSTTNRIFTLTGQILHSNASASQGEIIYLANNAGSKDWSRLAVPGTSSKHHLSNDNTGSVAWVATIWGDNTTYVSTYLSRDVQLLTGKKYLVDNMSLYQSSTQVILKNDNSNTSSSIALTVTGDSEQSLIWNRAALYTTNATATIGKSTNIFASAHINDLKLYASSGNGVITHSHSASSNNSYTIKWPTVAPGTDQILQSDNSGQLSWIAAPSSGSGSLWQFTDIQIPTGATKYLNPINDLHYRVVMRISDDTQYPIYAYHRTRNTVGDLISDDYIGATEYFGKYDGAYFKFNEVISIFKEQGDKKWSEYSIYNAELDASNNVTTYNTLFLSPAVIKTSAIQMYLNDQMIERGSSNTFYLPANQLTASYILYGSSGSATSWASLSTVLNATYNVHVGSILYRGNLGWDVYNTGGAPDDGDILSWNHGSIRPDWVTPLTEIPGTITKTISSNSSQTYEFTVAKGFFVDSIMVYCDTNTGITDFSIEVFQTAGKYLGVTGITHDNSYAYNLFFKEDNILLSNTQINNALGYSTGDDQLIVDDASLFSKYDLVKIDDEYYRVQDVVGNTITIYEGLDTDKFDDDQVNRIYERKNLGLYYNRSSSDKLYIKIDNNITAPLDYTVIIRTTKIL